MNDLLRVDSMIGIALALALSLYNPRAQKMTSRHPKPLPKIVRDTAKEQHLQKIPAKAISAIRAHEKTNKTAQFKIGSKQITLLPKPKRGTLRAFGYSTKLSRAGRIQSLVRAAKSMGSYGKVIRHLNLVATLNKRRPSLFKIYRSDMADLAKLNHAAKIKQAAKTKQAAALSKRKETVGQKYKTTHHKIQPFRK
jgi:hypothetical protein